ncbi:MAG: DUF3383 domain-containing protein, partial [Spirochaetaceae bacterium]|nr:DUF3383 domain-containing protein [Spirochaetaceae bacterium]
MLNLDNIINVAVSSKPTGLSSFNLNSLLLLTDEKMIGADSGHIIVRNAGEAKEYFNGNSSTLRLINTIFAQRQSLRSAGGYLVVASFKEGESPLAAVQRLEKEVYTVGILTMRELSGRQLEDLAVYIEGGDHLLFVPCYKEISLDIDMSNPSEVIYGEAMLLRAKGFKRSRALFYSGSFNNALTFAAAYAGLALSTNFSVSRSTATMHLKELVALTADNLVTGRLFAQIQAAGCDCYVNIAGLSVVYASGENGYFDSIYNITWFKLNLSVNYFNALKQTNHKIAQTEEGLERLKLAVLQSCLQAVNNGFVAAGSWVSSDYFGDKEIFLSNIEQMGFYIYTEPLAEQADDERAARKAPPVMVAIKEGGAFHKGS